MAYFMNSMVSTVWCQK